jgi:diacylglycerol O-acyltransferase 2, plant
MAAAPRVAVRAPDMKPMALWKHVIAYITLGLLCGWYYFLMVLYPLLFYGIYHKSYLAGAILALLVTLTFTRLDHKPWKAFQYCWIWGIWKEYFDFTFDVQTLTSHYDPKNRYFFFEYPHGVFPMGQFLSVSVVEQITPGRDICGTAADVVFSVPVMRQIMAWIGTRPAKRQQITKIFESGANCAVVVGGIAEMYLMNPDTESIYLSKRLSTVRTAIQEGAHIIPLFFFGNTRMFDILGADKGSDSLLSRLSRRLRMSIMFFYGRNFLPVPYRIPIKMVTGDVIEIKQCDNPSDELVQEVMNKVIESVKKVYAEKKPDWEQRPLVIN